MKLNNYQKILFSWGGLLLLGYLISIYTFSNMVVFFGAWAVIAAIAIIIQIKLGGFGDTKTKLIQALWILIIVIPGLVFNYFEYIGVAPVIGNGFVGWPATCAVGMVIVALFYRLNISYFILAVLYAVLAGLVYVMGDFTTLLIVSGVGFAVICSVDALMENTSLRKTLAHKPE